MISITVYDENMRDRTPNNFDGSTLLYAFEVWKLYLKISILYKIRHNEMLSGYKTKARDRA